MRNLNNELKELGLEPLQREAVLVWLNTLTNEELSKNGNDNLYCPPGDGPYVEFIEPTLEEQIQYWINNNISLYKEGHFEGETVNWCKIRFVRDLKSEFNLSLSEAKSHLDKNW